MQPVAVRRTGAVQQQQDDNDRHGQHHGRLQPPVRHAAPSVGRGAHHLRPHRHRRTHRQRPGRRRRRRQPTSILFNSIHFIDYLLNFLIHYYQGPDLYAFTIHYNYIIHYKC